MPVKIIATDVSDDPRVISLTDYKTGRANFSAHYFLSGCDTALGGQDITVQWADFNTAVDAYIKEYEVEPENVALRFVYAFDIPTLALKLRLQICTMTQSAADADVYNIDDKQCAWYALEDGKMYDAEDKSLTDDAYLQYMYYCEAATCDTDTAQNLADDKPDTLYARMVTFPWDTEVLQMYKDNDSPQKGYISFGACSYVTAGDGDAPVLYPHGTVIYLRDAAGTPLLNDENEVVLFHNKGCDMGTLCPPMCNIYVVPASK